MMKHIEASGRHDLELPEDFFSEIDIPDTPDEDLR